MPDPAPGSGVAGTAAPGPTDAPLAQEVFERVGLFVVRFRVAISNLQLYPGKASQAQRAVSAVYAPLTEILDRVPAVVLSEVEDNLLVNDARIRLEGPLKGPGRFLVDLFKAGGIKSISFRLGLSLPEMVSLMRALTDRIWERQPPKTVQQALEEEQAVHVALNERVFVAVSEQDIVIQGGAALAGKAGTQIDQIADVIQRVREMTGSGDAGASQKMRMQLLRSLVQEDPTLYTSLLQERAVPAAHEVPPVDAQGNLRVPQTLYQEAAVELASLYRTLSVGSAADDPALAPLRERLRAVLGKLLSVGEGRGDVLAVYREFVDKGEAGMLPEWWGERADPSQTAPEEKARRLLERDPALLLDPANREALPAMVRDLDLAQRDDLARSLGERVSENLEALVPDVRRQAAGALQAVIPALEACSAPIDLGAIDRRVVSQQDREVDEVVYRDLGGILVSRAGTLLKQGEAARIAEIVALFRRHRDPRFRTFDARPERAGEALEALAKRDVMDVLLADLRSKDEERAAQAREILIRFEELAVGPLLEALKGSEDPRTRQLLALLVRNLGPSAVARLSESVTEERSPLVIVRLLSVVRTLGAPAEVSQHLKGLLSHPVAGVRRELLRVLRDLAGPGLPEILLGAVGDASVEVRIEAISGLGAIRAGEAVDALLGLLAPRWRLESGEPEEVLAAAAAALGAIGDDRAVVRLVEILRGRTGPLRRSFSHAVRAAAVAALGRFGANPLAWKALQEALGDPAVPVRAAAERVVQEKITPNL